MRAGGPIPPRRLGVAAQLPRDRRRGAPQPRGDRPHRLTRRPGQRDLLPLSERQVTPLQVPTPPRAQPATGDHPSRALLAIRPNRFGRIGDELTTLQRRPEHLHVLADHVPEEPGHQHPHSNGVATTARTRETLNGLSRQLAFLVPNEDLPSYGNPYSFGWEKPTTRPRRRSGPGSTAHRPRRMRDGFWLRAPTNSVTPKTTPPCERSTTGNASRCGSRSSDCGE